MRDELTLKNIVIENTALVMGVVARHHFNTIFN